MAMSGGLQLLTFGRYFDQSFEDMSLPSDLQQLTVGRYFD